MQDICPSLKDEIVAIDGKALRHAVDEGQKISCIVSAWATNNGLALGQVKVDDKSNEITAVPELLRRWTSRRYRNPRHCGMSKDIAAKIIDKQADYVLALKATIAFWRK